MFQMISPGYYSQECNAHKQCKDPVKYCHMFLCVDCLKENVACTQNGQCCPSSECIYGRCKAGSTAGNAGKKLYNLLSVCTAPSCVSLPIRKFLNMWLNDLVL